MYEEQRKLVYLSHDLFAHNNPNHFWRAIIPKHPLPAPSKLPLSEFTIQFTWFMAISTSSLQLPRDQPIDKKYHEKRTNYLLNNTFGCN